MKPAGAGVSPLEAFIMAPMNLTILECSEIMCSSISFTSSSRIFLLSCQTVVCSWWINPGKNKKHTISASSAPWDLMKSLRKHPKIPPLWLTNYLEYLSCDSVICRNPYRVSIILQKCQWHSRNSKYSIHPIFMFIWSKRMAGVIVQFFLVVRRGSAHIPVRIYVHKLMHIWAKHWRRHWLHKWHFMKLPWMHRKPASDSLEEHLKSAGIIAAVFRPCGSHWSVDQLVPSRNMTAIMESWIMTTAVAHLLRWGKLSECLEPLMEETVLRPVLVRVTQTKPWLTTFIPMWLKYYPLV